MRNYHVVKLFLLIGLIFSFIQEAQGYPEAYFQTEGAEWVRSDNDSISSGIHLAQYTYSLDVINIADDSHTVLGNITYTLIADNIVGIDDEEYATRNGSFIHWVYPQDRVIGEQDGIFTEVRSGYYYSKYVPLNINRWTNKSIFNSNGFQFATFNVTFENSTYDSIWGGIDVGEYTKVNATVTERGYSAGGTNFTVTTPADMLPEHVHYASASTNISNTWKHTSFFLRGMRLNEIIKAVNSTTPTPTPTPTPTSTPAGNTKGDVNGDGQVSVVDALFVAQYTVGARTLTSSQLAAADVNGDGQVTIVDALFIAQNTVGLRQL